MSQYSTRMRLLSGLMAFVCTYSFGNGQALAEAVHTRAVQAARIKALDAEIAKERAEAEAHRKAVVAEMRKRTGADPKKKKALAEKKAQIEAVHPNARLEALASHLEMASKHPQQAHLKGLSTLLDEASKKVGSKPNDPLARKLTEAKGQLKLAQKGGAKAWGKQLALALDPQKPEPKKSTAHRREMAKFPKQAPRQLPEHGALPPELQEFYASIADQGWVQTPRGPVGALELSLGVEPEWASPMLASNDVASLLTDLTEGVLDPPGAADLAATPDADPTDPAVVALANQLGHDPLKIFNYVHDRFDSEVYYGSKKGYRGALAEQGGNDFDLSSLLISLYRASNIPARYEYGTVDLSPQQVLDVTGFANPQAAANALATEGVPVTTLTTADGTTVKAVRVERVWVRAYVPYGDGRGTDPNAKKLWVRLDPGLKRHQGSTPMVGRGLVNFDYASYLGSVSSNTPVEIFQAQLLAAAKAQNICDTLDSLLPSRKPIAENFGLLPVEHPGRNLSPLSVFSQVPDSMRATVTFGMGGTHLTKGLPELYGKAVTLRYVGHTQGDRDAIASAGSIAQLAQPYLVTVDPSLRIDGVEATRFDGDSPGNPQQLDVSVSIPRTSPIVIQHPLAVGGVYSFLVAPGHPGTDSVSVCQQGVARAKANGSAEDVDEALAAYHLALYAYETNLYITRLYGLEGYGALSDVEEGMAGHPLVASYAFGLPVSVQPSDYVLDIARESLTPYGLDGDTSRLLTLGKLAGYESSAREHSTDEEVLHYPGVSAVKAMQAAATNHIPVLTLTSSAQVAQLSGYQDSVLDGIRDVLGQGQTVLVPQTPVSYLTYPDVEAFIAYDPVTGSGDFRLAGLGAQGLLLNGDLGQPGSASSTNPGADQCPLPSCSSPGVATFTDGNHLEVAVDLTLPNPGIPLVFQRLNRSRSTRDLPLGFGWMHAYGMFLEPVGRNVTYVTENLQEVTFSPTDPNAPTPTSWVAPVQWHQTLILDGTGYHLRFKDGLNYDFDPTGKLTRQIDPNGNTISLTYDGAGHLATIYGSGGGLFTLTYDGVGRIHQVSDSAGRAVVYDHQGSDLTQVTDVLGKAEHYSYSPTHQLVLVTDKAGNQVSELYDESNRWIGAIDPLGRANQVVYDDLHHKAAYTDRNGHTQIWEWDERGLPVSITDPLGNVTTLGWDGAMNKQFVQNALGERTDYLVYDSQGNATQIRDAQGNISQYTYDASFNRPVQVVTSSLGVTTQNTIDPSTGNLLASVDGVGNRTEYHYQTNGLPDTITQKGSGISPDATTQVAYNPDGTLHTLSDPEGGTTTLGYDRLGHLTLVQDALGNSQSMVRDARGQVSSMTDGERHPTNFTYDELGNRTSATDAENHTTTYTYDALSRLTETTDALGNTSRTEYDAMGNVTARIDAKGQRTEYEYDEASRLLETRMADGAVQSLGYCASRSGSRVCDSVDPLGHLVHTDYDKLGRVSATTDSLGHVTSQEYDAAGRSTTRTDASNRTTHYNFDNANRLLSAQAADGTVISYGYDARGNRTSVTSPYAAGSATVSFTYDRANRLLSESNPLGQTTSYTYDLAGNRVTKLDGNGNTTTYAYDHDRRLKEVAFQDGSKYVFDYDANGNRTLEKHLGPGASTVIHERDLAYDALNRLQTTTDVTLGKTLRYTYDANGQRQTFTVDGLTTRYAYDAQGQLQQVTDPDGDLTLLRYDSDGKRSRMVLGNGVVARYGYDSADRLTSIAYQNQSGVVLQGFGYTLDNTGNRLSKQFADGSVEGYGYDIQNHLNQVTYGSGRSDSYSLDPAGNITQFYSRPAGAAYQNYDLRTVNGFNQLIQLEHHDQNGARSYTQTFTYDGNGNLALQHDTAGTSVDLTYTYDLDNRLVGTGQALGPQWASSASVSSNYIGGGEGYLIGAADGRYWQPSYPPQDGSPEWLETGFPLPALATGVDVYEGGSVGGVQKVELKDAQGSYHTVFTGPDATTASPGVLQVRFAQTSYPVVAAKVTLQASTTAGQPDSYVIDAVRLFGNLPNPTSTAYAYDANGLRTQKVDSTGTTQYLLDGASVVEELDGTGGLSEYHTNNPQKVDEQFSLTQGSTKFWPIADALGSIYGFLDRAGAMRDSYAYEAYGKRTQLSGTDNLAWGFTGREHESDLSFTFNRARFFDTRLGIWSQQDKMSISDNLYLYSLGEPTLLSDPSGFVGQDISSSLATFCPNGNMLTYKQSLLYGALGVDEVTAKVAQLLHSGESFGYTYIDLLHLQITNSEFHFSELASASLNPRIEVYADARTIDSDIEGISGVEIYGQNPELGVVNLYGLGSGIGPGSETIFAHELIHEAFRETGKWHNAQGINVVGYKDSNGFPREPSSSWAGFKIIPFNGLHLGAHTLDEVAARWVQNPIHSSISGRQEY